MLSTCFTNLPLLYHHHFFFHSIVNIFYQTHSGLRQFKNMSQKGECFLQLRNSWSLLLFLEFHKINMYTLSIPNKHFRICEKEIYFYNFCSILLWRAWTTAVSKDPVSMCLRACVSLFTALSCSCRPHQYGQWWKMSPFALRDGLLRKNCCSFGFCSNNPPIWKLVQLWPTSKFKIWKSV